MLVERFFRRVGTRALQRGDCRIGVAVASCDVGADKCFGIVFDFLLLDRIGLAEFEDHMSCAGLSAGGHRSDVCRFKQEKSGGACACARGRDVDDDGNAGSEFGGDHGTHGFDHTSGRVHFDEEGLGAIVACAGDCLLKFRLGDRLNGVVELEFVDERLLRVNQLD